MENVVSIVNSRTNELEFDITIQGIDTKETRVRFVIEASPVFYGFDCTKVEGDNDKWTVSVPPLPQLEHAGYPFRLEVIIDGYYFEPYRGTATIMAEPAVKSAEINSGRPSAPVVSVSQSKPEVEEDEEDYQELDSTEMTASSGVPDDTQDDDEEDEAARLADILLRRNAQESTKVTKDPIKEATTSKVDKAIHEAITDFIKKPLKPILKKEKEVNVFEQDADEVLDAAIKQVDESSKDVKLKQRTSNLAAAINKVNKEPELSEQARKVREILGTPN